MGASRDEEHLPQAFKITAIPYEEIRLSTVSKDFVEGLLCIGALSVVYGDSNVGKTFVVLDLALHVAAGVPWCGMEIDAGGVLYLALEGGQGISNRVAAWKLKNPERQNLPFFLVAQPMDFLGEGKDAVIERVNATSASFGAIKLIIIDTLSRALAGGDENSSQAMGALVKAMDEIREKTGAHVMLIHHTGKNQERGARGHSLLRAAADTEIEIGKGKAKIPSAPKPSLEDIIALPMPDNPCEVISLNVTKQRDLSSGKQLAFVLLPVPLGTNGRGKLVVSCVVELAALGIAASVEKEAGAATKAAMEVLDRLISQRGQQPPPELGVCCRAVLVANWRSECYAKDPTATNDAKKKKFQRAREALTKAGKIQTRGDWVWVNDAGGH